MPGIVGLITRDASFGNAVTVEKMVAAMMHEKTYASGTCHVPELALWAGWVSHHGSFSDCLPIWNERRDICLLFVGEHFAGRDEIERLRSLGHCCPTEDASYLVHLYEEQGAKFFEELNGVFCGLVVDMRSKELLLFNDRYGLGRVYWHHAEDGFYFASEAKALLRVVPRLRELDVQGLGEYLACGFPLQNRTIFSKVSLLPPASLWALVPGQPPRRGVYFQRRTWEEAPRLSLTDYYERLKSAFASVLPRYFQTSQQIAMSLTGGLDGRIIMAWLGADPGSLPCYTHCGIFNECQDARIARRVAAVCRQPHRLVMVDGAFLDTFPNLARQAVYLTDGAMDVSGAAGLYANRVVGREIAPVRVTGNYGGQILRGLLSLKPRRFYRQILSGDFTSRLDNAAATLAGERQGCRASAIAFKQVPWEHYPRYALEQSQLTVRSPYLDNQLVALSYHLPADRSANERLCVRLIGDGNPALVAFPTDRGSLPGKGLTGRWSKRYQEFTFKADYAYDYGMPHWLVRVDRLLAPLHLERMFLGRHKYYHFRYFYRYPLSGFVRDVLLDPGSLARPYLDRTTVERIVTAHLAGRGNYTLEIHLLLTAELIHRELLGS